MCGYPDVWWWCIDVGSVAPSLRPLALARGATNDIPPKVNLILIILFLRRGDVECVEKRSSDRIDGCATLFATLGLGVGQFRHDEHTVPNSWVTLLIPFPSNKRPWHRPALVIDKGGGEGHRRAFAIVHSTQQHLSGSQSYACGAMPTKATRKHKIPTSTPPKKQ